jgi:hypothetical protein
MEERKRQASEERKASRRWPEVDLGRAWSRQPATSWVFRAAAWLFSVAASSLEMMAHETEAPGVRFSSHGSSTACTWADDQFSGPLMENDLHFTRLMGRAISWSEKMSLMNCSGRIWMVLHDQGPHPSWALNRRRFQFKKCTNFSKKVLAFLNISIKIEACIITWKRALHLRWTTLPLPKLILVYLWDSFSRILYSYSHIILYRYY